jgi:hypothetical protein
VARKRRQLVVMGAEKNGAALALGSRKDFAAVLSCFNTGPDGGVASTGGTEFLYGPGMVIEVPTTTDQVMQAIASINDEDLALPVLMKMCKKLGWRMMDIESGRMFG